MKIINKNPYRVLGLQSNCTEREIQKQISVIKRYAEVGKSKVFDYDFEFLGSVQRDIESVNNAASSIERDENKIRYSLFWYVNKTSIDDVAISHLKNNNIKKAFEIWKKSLRDEVSEKNYSSYHNISTLLISTSFLNAKIDLNKLLNGIVIKGKVLQSVFCNDLVSLFISGGMEFTKEKVLEIFTEEMLASIRPHLNNKSISPNILLNLFNTYPEFIRSSLEKDFTEEPFSKIETLIDQTANKRKDNPYDADEYGEQLFLSTKVSLQFLTSVLGTDNVRLNMVRNKLAEEVLQCAIEFFNDLVDDDEYDPGVNALKLAKIARSIGADGHVQQRIEENIEGIQEWVNDADERKKAASIQNNIVQIAQQLADFHNKAASTTNVRNLLDECKPHLGQIRTVVGRDDENYIQMCDAVVGNALGMLIETVNRAQDPIVRDQSAFNRLSTVVNTATSITRSLKLMDMSSSVRSRVIENLRVIESINNQISAAKENMTSSNSGACYIATMVYGDYDHPRVKVLRLYRDNTLSRTFLGRLFIKAYYIASPHFVDRFRSNQRMHKLIKIILDTLVNRIRKSA